MSKYIKSKLTLFFGIFFLASLSADPLLHDHIDEHQSQSIVECQLCENKVFITNFLSLSLFSGRKTRVLFSNVPLTIPR